MNISHLHESNRRFLLQSAQLCMVIDPYVTVLGLDPEEVGIFKNEVQTVLYITGRYKSFADSFILYNMGSMRRQMTTLVHDCMHSANYTRNIGKVLGIEEQAEFNAFALPELDFYKGLSN